MTEPVVITDAQITVWSDRLRKQASARPGERLIVGIAGIPGSGKSTLSRRFVDTMNLTEPGIAAELPMDGFHFSNAELANSGRIDKKGAPSTFAVEAYLETLAKAVDRSNQLVAPAYDRSVHEPTVVNSPHQIGEMTQIVVTEGNYILLKQSPWTEVMQLLHCSFFLQCALETAHKRLIRRHVKGGRDVVSAEKHYQQTDYPNTRLVIDCSNPATYDVTWES